MKTKNNYKKFYVLSPSLMAMVIAYAMILLFISCEDDSSIIPTAADEDIVFSSYVENRISRGTVENVETIEKKGFGIFGMYTDNNKKYGSNEDISEFNGQFMRNTNVIKDGDNWEYSPIRYWPNTSNEYLSFIAYAPWKENLNLVDSTGKNSGDMTYYEYSINKNGELAYATQTYDLMYNSNNTLNLQCIQDDNKVKLHFKHGTARIAYTITSTILSDSHNFKAGESSSDASITINRLLLGGRINEDTSLPKGIFYSEGYLNLNCNSNVDSLWSIPFKYDTSSSHRIYYSLINTEDSTNVDEIKGERFSNNGKEVYEVNSISNSVSNYLFIIPQDFREKDELFCYIDYTVKYKSLDIKGDSTCLMMRYSAVGCIKQNFEAGKAYSVILDIGKLNNGVTSFNPILLSISSVDNWNEETNTSNVIISSQVILATSLNDENPSSVIQL